MKNLKTSLLSLLLAVMLVFGTIAPVLPAFADEQPVTIEEAAKTAVVSEELPTGEAAREPAVVPTVEPTILPVEGKQQLLEGAIQPATDTSPSVKVDFVDPLGTTNPLSVPLQNAVWEVGDFIYVPTDSTDMDFNGNKIDGVKIKGFSDAGIEKLKNNKNVVLSPVNDKGEIVKVISGSNPKKPLVNDFCSKGITSISLPDDVVLVKAAAFSNNQLNQIKLPQSLEVIEMCAFQENEITDVVFGESNLSIGANAFKNNRIAQINIPESVQRILKGKNPLEGNPEKNTINVGTKVTYKKLESIIKKVDGLSEAQKNPTLIAAVESAKNESQKFVMDSKELTKVDELVNKINDAISSNEPLVLKSIDKLADVYVERGTSESVVETLLPTIVTVYDNKNITHQASVKAWKVLNYNSSQFGEYLATAMVEVPSHIKQATPPVDLVVQIKIKVVEAIAATSDYTFSGTTITGLSKQGIEKFKTCKVLALPTKNSINQVITEVADAAFIGKISTRQDSDVGINTVFIPYTIKVIGKEAFRYNAIKSITFPEGITTIKDSAFNGNLIQNVSLPDSVTELGLGAFTLNEISTLKLSKGLKRIPVAFGYNKLKTVTIPEGVIGIDDMAFSDNDLKEAILPNTLEYLSGFNNNEFATITIPKSVKVIGKKAFARNRIKEVVIPGNVISIGESAFQNSWHDVYLEKVTLEEGIQKLDKYAFSSNQLREVNLPASLKELDPSAFYKNLGYNETLVTHLFTPDLKNPKGLKNAKFHQVNPAKLTINYVLNGKIEKTETIVTHPESKGYFTIGDTVSIKPSFKHTAYGLVDPNPVNITLNGKENTLTFQLQNKVIVDTPVIETIGRVPAVAVSLGTSTEEVMKKLAKKSCIFDSNGKEYAVDLIWKLESYSGNKVGEFKAKATFLVPMGVSIVGGSLKPELETVVIVKQSPAVLKSSNWAVDDFIIENKEIYGDPHIAVLGFSAKGEEKLKTNKALVIPKTNANGDLITAIYQEAFEDKGLTSVVLPEGLPSLDIGSAAFQLNELTDVVIPDGVKEIRTYAFNKNNLRTVDIPKTVTKIGNKAFSDNKLVVVNFSLDIENVWLDRFSFNNNLLSEVTIIKDPGKIHHEAFKDNIGYDNNKNRVKVYTLNLNVDDQNHVFPYSHYHEMVMLKIENINDIPGMKDQVELILSNGDKVKVDEKKCKSQDFNKKRQEQLANKNKTPGTPGNQGNAGKPGAPGSGNGNAQGNKPGAPNVPQVPGSPTVPNIKGAPANPNAPNITKYKDMAKVQWAQEAVKDLSDKKIISGYKNDYRPNDKMKKAEFAAILVKAFELEEVKTDLDFKDVKKSDWYYDAISKLAALDMVSGDGTGKFNPEDEITREQMIKMLMQLMNSKYPERLNTVEGVTGFKDHGKVSSWASEEMEQAMALNLISGFSDSTIKPQDETTRGQAAVVVYKALQLVE